jgi:hypothetical protein
MCVSASTHRRTNSSGVSASCVGDGSDELDVGDGLGGSADDEESSLHEDSASRPQHVRAARKALHDEDLPRSRQPSPGR